MTLLSICRTVTDVVGVQRPSAIVAGTSQLERQLYGFAIETVEELSKMDWPVLCRAVTLPTVVDQQAYDLPPDYEHQIGDTVYGVGRYHQLRGQLSPGDWANQRNVLPDLGMYRFRIYGYPLKVNLVPAPQVVEDIVYEYKTSDRVLHADTTTGPEFTADTDTTLVPEDLVRIGIKWRLRRGLGLDYSEEFNNYELVRAERLAQQLQFGSSPVAIRGYGDEPLTNGYIPETGFG